HLFTFVDGPRTCLSKGHPLAEFKFELRVLPRTAVVFGVSRSHEISLGRLSCQFSSGTLCCTEAWTEDNRRDGKRAVTETTGGWDGVQLRMWLCGRGFPTPMTARPLDLRPLQTIVPR
ncbi:hypothetical protein BU15DRAFT_56841, partial [Melanogaster broomeanus]